MAGLIDEIGLLSTELYDVGIPDARRERFFNADGRVGVLLGRRTARRRILWTDRCLPSGWSTSSC